MTKMKGLAVVIAVSMLSTVSMADIWEPGLGVSVNFAPIHEIEGSSGNSMDGRSYGGALRYSTPDPIPISAGISYQRGSSNHSGDPAYSSASANSTVINAELLAGKVFFPGNLEFVPYLGLGFRQMSQHFSSDSYPDDNDIATPKRTHRHLYVPVGLYLGSAQPLDHFDFYLSAEYRRVVMGEVSLRKNGGGHMTSNEGNGVRTEMGVHFPSDLSFNMYAGVYYEWWDVYAPDRGVSVSAGLARAETEPRTKQTSAGVTLGLQF